MASAEREVKVIGVTLNLSEQEAQFLLDYIGHTMTGGGSVNRLGTRICSALTLAGMEYSHFDTDNVDLTKSGAGRVFVKDGGIYKGLEGGY